MAWDAYNFGDKSDGLLSIPLWIPQAMMLFGIGLFSLSLIEELIKVLRGLKPIYQQRAEAMREPDDEDETGTVSDRDRKE
jgi:TRAP-type C4-dicarboxylate transport system permease small subunit